ncbi:MAG TPA: sensor domain-containing protein [Steroidobacteraceae bacterium]|nr:sensor domain-containing protein [Steroidobacteraceae bacterium]
MNRPAPRSIDQYLAQLKDSLKGEDPALVQDALYDAEEYLRAELASHAGKSEADVLELIASTYGAPEEVAEAYRTTEKTVREAMKPMAPPPRKSALGRFFGIYADSRAWTALFFMLLSLVTGIFYFTVAVTGLAMSVGFAVLIIGVPFFLLFIGLTRVLSLVEGRIVEGLLGVRMPRRPLRSTRGIGIGARIREMLLDRRTWTTLLYMLLMLPLGVCYFTAALVAVVLSAVSVAAPLVALLHGFGLTSADIQFDGEMIAWPLTLPLCVIGIFAMTAVMHGVRLLGELHGRLARALLLSRDGE